ncbi:MAG: HAD family hydrolase [Microcoleus sp. PH2017_10_PVI_O_A]|nr:HAD family hydrolase [Microcoleus sp. PH2017_10_PVI_O_A]MCC3459910.1 HAD family hydrolase [Microcoleus sp. PH2017_11_PCY_U_A]MCC3478290.1 HAD family hydrolase [Microcoleus sp. PH2017_12_PCY_D_A]MCC3559277.1 HAD family hydrolase [Microcoleus sp. PH2017_27_LUM_O_A]TAE80611.1 MAG: HAD family hydrolase [Oscillatoriales cyanobacterium]
MKPEAILCDRDGTLIQDCHFLRTPDQIEWIPGVLAALKILKELQIKVLVLTNQSGVARGYFPEEAVNAVNDKMRRDAEAATGAIADFYFCPHHPQGQVIQYTCVCECRKPSPGLFLQAIADRSLDPTRCWAIGDRLRDLEPGLQLGMKAFLVKTGYGIQEQQDLSKSLFSEQITVVSSLPEIIDLI